MDIENLSDNNNLIIQDKLPKKLIDMEITSTPSTGLSPSTWSNVSVLTDHLILTNGYFINKKFIEDRNITCIINVTCELDVSSSITDDIIYHKIPILDLPQTQIAPHFDEAADLIQKVANEGGKTVVYCVAGVSRSASICLAYFMKHQKMKLLQAYNYVKERRRIIRPNCGFFEQLIKYERTLYKKNTVKMVFNKCVNMRIPSVYDAEYNYENKIVRDRFSRLNNNCKII